MKKIINYHSGNGAMSCYFCAFLLLFLSTSNLSAQNCKPDYSQKDKIENKQVDAWMCELYETSLGGSMLRTSQVSITFSIGRMENSNFIQLHLQKKEESAQNALFESTLKGAKGDEFYLAIKDSDPLKFVADQATNQTKANSFSRKLVTTVVLSSYISDNDLKAIKDVLTKKLINATRIKLENDLIIDQQVKDKNGKKAMEKATCFFNYLQEKGLMKSGGEIEESSAVEDKKNQAVVVKTAQAEKGNTLTNASVIDMVKLKLSEAIIIQKIKLSKCNFDTSPAALSALTKAGVKDNIMMAMMDKQ